MYALADLFAIRSGYRAALRLSAGAGACLLLSACIGNPFKDAQVDPNSPIAPEVARLAHNTGQPYPTFASIPPVPKDVRPPRQYGRAAGRVDAARTKLEAETADDTWSVTDPEAFAAKARAAAGSEAAPAASDTEGYANSQRKRATPPPPPPN
jgi:hypothetical protein